MPSPKARRWSPAANRTPWWQLLPADHHGQRSRQRQSGERGDLRPAGPLFRFKDEADVIARANDTEFGLAAYFYARDLSRVFRVGEALEYGIIGINTGIISTEVAPFGGVRPPASAAKGRSTASKITKLNMCIGL